MCRSVCSLPVTVCVCQYWSHYTRPINSPSLVLDPSVSVDLSVPCLSLLLLIFSECFDFRHVRHLTFHAHLLTVMGTTLAAPLFFVALMPTDLLAAHVFLPIEFRFHGLVIKAMLSYSFSVRFPSPSPHSQYTIYPLFPFMCAFAPFNTGINSLVSLLSRSIWLLYRL